MSPTLGSDVEGVVRLRADATDTIYFEGESDIDGADFVVRVEPYVDPEPDREHLMQGLEVVAEETITDSSQLQQQIEEGTRLHIRAVSNTR